MPKITIPSWAQSSLNPSEVSLTITSLGKAAVSIVTTIAILKGVDPAIATTDVTTVTQAAQNIVAQYAAVIPAAYAAYQSGMVIWGLVRKGAVRMFATVSTV